MERLIKNERGFTLIEVMIALLLLGIIGIAFMGGLANVSRALFVGDEQATAESLARSQIEYVKRLPYASSYSPAPMSAEYASDGYSASITAAQLVVGLQRIRVTISHHGDPIVLSGNYTLEAYKGWR